jgi:hypothetical protein
MTVVNNLGTTIFLSFPPGYKVQTLVVLGIYLLDPTLSSDQVITNKILSFSFHIIFQIGIVS